MVVIILPEWVTELEEKLDKVILNIARKNNISLIAVDDSKSIENGKDMISDTLVRLFENYGVEERKRMDKFMKEINIKEKKGK